MLSFRNFMIRALTAILNKSPRLYNLAPIRKFFWTICASDCDRAWGQSEASFEFMKAIISAVSPRRILDVGCGSGRFFSLYHSMGIGEIVGQDIASSALRIASKRYSYPNLTLTSTPIAKLPYAKDYFDLVISIRMLQHIPKSNIEEIVRKLCEISDKVFVNELSDADFHECDYMFKHDYRSIFEKNGFIIKDQGLFGRQQWHLFARSTP
jgi:ubiquinone/menaquinone biosynthesis C-methylase UbiE